MPAKHPCTLAYAWTIDVIDLAVGIIINTILHWMQRWIYKCVWVHRIAQITYAKKRAFHSGSA
jgi:hypothetical protein